jgi:cell division septation protein DedD
MSSTSENETEILLGNRHLLAIFFVLAVLLGIAFTGGYMVGRNGSEKKGTPLSAAATDPAASTSTGLETHALTPSNDNNADGTPPPPTEQTHTVQPPPTEATPPASREDTPLGSPKKQETSPEDAPVTVRIPAAKPTPPPEPHAKTSTATFAGPQSGQTFLQVAAVGHTEANALADVLSKKGFHAHAVPKPGASDVYRVLIGPMRDTSELSTTRDSLRNAGFTKIFVQRY